MKKMWKIKKDSEGVSPVIATILMVAITVVLAAVLLVLVLNIGEDSISVSGQISFVADGTESGGNLSVIYISQGVAFADVDVLVGGESVKTHASLVGTGNTVVSGSVITLAAAAEVSPGDTVQLVYDGSVIGTTTAILAP